MKFISIILIIVSSQITFAEEQIIGGSSGGGGKGIFCPDGAKWFDLLDLWEARTLYDRHMAYDTQPLEKQVRDGVQKLKNILMFDRIYRKPDGTTIDPETVFMDFMTKETEEFLDPNSKKVKRLHKVKLTVTDDSFEDVLPDGCEIVQLVIYKDSYGSPALMDADRFDKMLTTPQAALIVHEALYKFLREYGNETDSITTRRAVGYVFSEQFKPFTHIGYFIKGIPHVSCEDKINSGDTFDNHTIIHFVDDPGQNHTSLVVQRLYGYFPLAHERPIGFMPGTLDENYRKLFTEAGSQASLMYKGHLTHSIVDFDMQLQMSLTKGSKPSVSFKRRGHQNPTMWQTLDCKYFPR